MTTEKAKRPAKDAISALQMAGYGIVAYPDADSPTNLIVRNRQGDTVTTLPVTDGQVCDESVVYLVSEANYDKDPARHG